MVTPGENCERHELEINRLRDKTSALMEDLLLEKGTVIGLQRDHAAMRELIPLGLGETVGRMDEKIDALRVSIGDIIGALKSGYVTTAEFESMKKLFWAGVAAIVLGFITIGFEMLKAGALKP